MELMLLEQSFCAQPQGSVSGMQLILRAFVSREASVFLKWLSVSGQCGWFRV